MVGNKYIFMFVFMVFPFFVFCKNARLRHAYSDDKNEIKIDLIARSYNGDVVNQVELGRPFLVEVVVQGPGSLGEPKIQNFNGRRTGVQVKTVNGDTTAKYSYHVVANSSGMLRIGPAILDISSVRYESNVLEVAVGEIEEIAKDSHSGTDQKEEFFAELFLDKTAVMIGEKVRVTLRYYTSEKTSIQKLIIPEMADFQVIQTNKPLTSFEEKEGYYYDLVEWSWDLYPKKVGKIAIPSHALDILVQSKKAAHLFGIPSFFSGFHAEHKRVYSNALTLSVNPLPSHEGSIDAVGNFMSFELRVDKKEVTIHDAVVATLELVGDPVETVDSFQLKDMPESVRWYDSKSVIKDGVAGLKKKSWEFIVQPLQSGTFVLPSQTFSFFDITQNQYKTLKSNPIEVSVLGHENSSSQGQLSDVKNLQKEFHVDNHLESEVAAHMCLSKEKKSSDYGIPFPFFLVIIVLILMVTSFQSMRSFWQESDWYQSPVYQTKRAFRSARNRLKLLEKNKEYRGLYTLFEQLIIEITRINKSFVKETTIGIIGEKITEKKGLIESWKHFFKQIEQITFFPTLYDQEIPENLFEQARYWIDQLEKGLK